MSISEIIQTKEVDIYISLFFTILGLILGFIVDTLTKGSSPAVNGQQTPIINLTVSNVVNPPSASSSKPDQDMMPIICTAMAITALIYLFYRAEILNILSWITIFTLSLWAGGTLHSLYKGYFSGGSWIASLLFSVAFCVAATLMTGEAFRPTHAPENFIYIQEIINKYGITGLKRYFNPEDFNWLILHLFGVLILFYASIRMMLSSTYFITTGFANPASATEPWITQKTRKYANQRKNIIYMPILLLLAYALISGAVSIWLTHDMPGQLNQLIDTILHGR
ncbi:hypothetical protein [Pseudomonas koreensis]|uniref:hypothetical protein n=1 Tax=Pseudomonas koreensis TaxID=198620 RepID=UPI00147290B6|nr:hypothetical protein [Pseudomonas koreensis]NNA58257.1 hypothetical protein [Pseudomonas koreensis]